MDVFGRFVGSDVGTDGSGCHDQARTCQRGKSTLLRVSRAYHQNFNGKKRRTSGQFHSEPQTPTIFPIMFLALRGNCCYCLNNFTYCSQRYPAQSTLLCRQIRRIVGRYGSLGGGGVSCAQHNCWIHPTPVLDEFKTIESVILFL